MSTITAAKKWKESREVAELTMKLIELFAQQGAGRDVARIAMTHVLAIILADQADPKRQIAALLDDLTTLERFYRTFGPPPKLVPS